MINEVTNMLVNLLITLTAGTVTDVTELTKAFMSDQLHCFITPEVYLTFLIFLLGGITTCIFFALDQRKRKVALIILVVQVTFFSFFTGMILEKGLIKSYYKRNIDDYIAENYESPDFYMPVESLMANIPEPSPSPGPSPITEYEVTITDPIDGEKVNQKFVVTGEIEGDVPEDEYLWVIVNIKDNAYAWWPQGETIDTLNHEFRVSATIGDRSSAGDEFYIYVISVSEDNNEMLTDYVNTCKMTGRYPSISFPNNARIIAKAMVERD